MFELWRGSEKNDRFSLLVLVLYLVVLVGVLVSGYNALQKLGLFASPSTPPRCYALIKPSAICQP